MNSVMRAMLAAPMAERAGRMMRLLTLLNDLPDETQELVIALLENECGLALS